AGALGGTLALGALRYAPEASAEVAGLLACPGQAATVAQDEALDLASGQKAWRLNVPQLRCANAKGVPHVGAASLNGRWCAAGAPVRAASLFRAHRGVLVMKSVSPEEPLEDYPAQFLAECCDVGSRKRMTSAELHAAYAAWCRAKGQRPLGRKHLTRDWKRLG